MKWTDVELAHWTVVLAIATIALVATTIWITSTDRRRDSRRRKSDREEAAERLAEERAEIDRRVAEERKAAEDRATRQRQVVAATSLLQRIADVDPFMRTVPNLDKQTQGTPSAAAYEAARDAVGNLKKGALAEALALHSPTGTRLYQALVQLYLSAVDGRWKRVTPNVTPAFEERTVGDLRHYTRHVRLCLHQLINDGAIPVNALGPNPDEPDIPNLARSLDGDSDPWTPIAWTPPGWDLDSELDLTDPNRRFDPYR
ncbi:hypothetical protein [Streptomyces sp. MBT53]|uniref:hypothetical protein n=1 Tax=Streptomyces sp. MBT53 TaxID=1488384 RepID=UPI001912F292|nr:hypothetical protein [Streptomyces sp. MBT53]MBK6015168.1 hypothetical protein [Streptomyces sp. MBT53]